MSFETFALEIMTYLLRIITEHLTRGGWAAKVTPIGDRGVGGALKLALVLQKTFKKKSQTRRYPPPLTFFSTKKGGGRGGT